MIKSASEIRAAARESLSGKWGGAVLMCLVYMVITTACSSIPAVGYLLALILLPLGWGYNVAFLENARDKSEFKLEKMFAGIHDYTRLFYTLLLQTAYTFLWTLCLIVPGIIKSYSYAMTPYILKDEPELKNNAAIEKSMAMMSGHKFDLFYLQLTFIGWGILSILTLGLGLLWLSPYMASATAHFYEDVKADYASRSSYDKA